MNGCTLMFEDRPDAQGRFHLLASREDDVLTDLAEDVRAGLTSIPKRLSCRFFYDAEGSRLFEEISQLPEYYLTRAERDILRRFAEEIVAHCPRPLTLVELGSGSAAKTTFLIEALGRSQPRLRYVPIDISPTALRESSVALLDRYRWLEITAIASDYEQGVGQLAALGGNPKLILWLGSNIGNLERSEAGRFLRRLRELMRPDDRILIGIDLRKDREILQLAYDDPGGVTARFNLNLLARINRELGGCFDLRAFAHEAVYNETLGRMEMYLTSRRRQVVEIERLALTVTFEEGEKIHTENSYKYAQQEIERLVHAGGLRLLDQWFDHDRLFSDILCAVDDRE